MSDEPSYNWKDSAIRRMVIAFHIPRETRRASGSRLVCAFCKIAWPCPTIAEYRSKKKWWWVLVD